MCATSAAKKSHKISIQWPKLEPSYIWVTSTFDYIHFVHAAKPRYKANTKKRTYKFSFIRLGTNRAHFECCSIPICSAYRISLYS